MSPLKFVLVLLAATAVAATPALAERSGNHKKYKRSDRSLFDVLFGKKKAKREEARKKARRDTARNIDPEAAPRQRLKALVPDEGNLVYQGEKLERVFAARFTEPEPANPDAAAIRAALLDAQTPLRAPAADKKAAIDFYRTHGFGPIWAAAPGRRPALLALFAAAAEDGLDPAEFALPDTAGPAEADLALTLAALKYARQASGGRLLPGRLSTYNDVTPERAEPAAALRVIAWSPWPETYLRSLHPAHPAYAAMRAELAKLRAGLATGRREPIPAGKRLKAGDRDPRLIRVRHRLAELGFADAEIEAARADGLTSASGKRPDPAALDPALSRVLRSYQKRQGLKSTGALDAGTLRALNGSTEEADIQRLALNMERLRWLPKHLGARHVFVNQAAFELELRDGATVTWRTKVVVGKPDSQTAAFHDEMETVVFNPSWGVPPSIVADEMLPILRRDPTYLDRKGFTVVNRHGKRVRSSSVKWASYGDAIPFSILQPPGDDNALGEIKFLFPNAHHIYMHDTPSRMLFSRPVRAFSHGCVRVENPRKFASLILGIGESEVAARIAEGRSRSVRLKTGLPVHIAYFTAWPDSSGRILYHGDVYGRDRHMERVLNTRALAANSGAAP